MAKLQKKVFSGLLILCAIAVFIACKPDPDPKIPTDRVVIKNIPAKMFRTDTNPSPPPPATAAENTFKVFVQLSNTMSPDTSFPGLGKASVSSGTLNAFGKYDVTIENLFDYNGNPWARDDWTYVSVIISPENVTNIFDMDMRAYMTAPSKTSSTVVLDWEALWPKTTMFSGYAGIDPVDNYIRLFNGRLEVDDDGGTAQQKREGVIRIDIRQGIAAGDDTDYIKGVTPIPLNSEISVSTLKYQN